MPPEQTLVDSKSKKGRRHPAHVDQLSFMQHACQQLANCDSLDEIKDIRDKAEAVRQYARNAKAGLELQNRAAELKIRAERRAGELLHTLTLRGGDRVSESAGCRTTLEQLEISQNQSTRWQKLATIPESVFSELLTLAHRSDLELTTAHVLRIASSREKGQSAVRPGNVPPVIRRRVSRGHCSGAAESLRSPRQYPLATL